ncbi:MAG: hypothetical protein HYT87_00085 [Nitrospirae bacterium]|nr:hypothetical protein [Nitrospirota bacterium]
MRKTFTTGLLLSGVFAIGVAAGPGGCGGSEKESSPATATGTSTATTGSDQAAIPEATTPTTPTTGTTSVAPPKPSKASDVLLKVTNAVTTSMTAGGSSLIGGSTARGASLEPLPGAPPRASLPGMFRYPVQLEPTCTDGASPLDASGIPLPDLDPKYAPALFYCVLKQPGTGPESPLGRMLLTRGFVCLAEKAVPDLTYNGSSRTATVNPADSECFPDNFVPNFPAQPIQVTITASSPSAFGKTGAWDRSLQIVTVIQGESLNLQLLLKDGEGLAVGAGRFIKESDKNDAYTFHLDTQMGVLRYEQKNQDYDNPQPDENVQTAYNRHARVRIAGTVNSDGVFSQVTDYQGAVGNLYKHKIGDSTLLHTIRGNPAAGFKGIGYKDINSGTADLLLNPSNYSAVASCSGSGDCSGNSGLRVMKAEDLDFLMHPAGPRFTAGDVWFESLSPLTFNEVSLADSQP